MQQSGNCISAAERSMTARQIAAEKEQRMMITKNETSTARSNQQHGRKTGKQLAALAVLAAFSAGTAFSSFAGTWQKDVFGAGIWNYADTNEVQKSGWKWLDGNKDGLFECYYFDSEGKMAANTTIGTDQINADGQWIVNGVIQQRTLPSWLQYKKQLIEDKQQNAAEKLAYPQISLSGSDTGEAVNQTIRSYVETVRQENKPEGDTFGYASENSLDYDFLLSRSGKYAGLSFQNYVYQEGAAHGMTAEQYFTLAPEKGILKMSDIGGKELENAVTAYVRNELKNRTTGDELVLFVDPNSLSIDYSRNNWLLADDGLHVIFQQYEIAPYAAGLIDVTVPYSAIRGQMNAYGQGLIS